MDSVDTGSGGGAVSVVVEDAEGAPLTTAEVAEATANDVDAVRSELEALLADGHVESRTVGDERIWWVSSEDSASTAIDQFESIPAMVYRCRQAEGWPMAVVQGNCERVTGYEAADLESGAVDYGEDVIHPADYRSVWDTIEAARGTGEPFTTQYRIRTPSGDVRWVWERGRFVDEDDDVLVGVITNIDDQKRTEQALREETAFTESLLDAQHDVVYAYDRDGEMLRWNDRMTTVTGYDDDEIADLHSLDFIVPEERDRVQSELAPVLLEGEHETTEFTLRTSDGEHVPYELTAAPLEHEDEIVGVTGVGRDITARLHREAELRHERDVVERILESVGDCIFVVDRTGSVVRANERAIERFNIEETAGGYELGDTPVYDEAGEFIPIEDRPYTRVFETGEPLEDWHCQIDLPDLGQRWVSITAEPVFEEDEVTQVIVTSRDITRLKSQTTRLERQRDELESELTQVLERVQDGFMALDDEWRFTYVNERAEELVQRSEGELLGQSIWEVFPETVDSQFEAEYRRAMTEQESVSFEAFYEPLDAWFRVNAYPSESGLSLYFEDVTEEKARRQALREREARHRTLTEDVLDTSEVGTFILDSDFDIVWMNRAVEAYFGLDRDAVIGRDKRSVIEEQISDRLEDAERFSDLVTATYDDNTYTEEFECHVLPGEGREERWLQHWSQPIRSGLYEGGRIEHYTDVTARVDNARELERRVTGQRALTEFSRFALENRPLEEIFEEAIDLIADVFGHTYAKVLELEPDGEQLRMRHGHGWSDDIVGSATVSTDRGSQAGYTLITEEPVVSEDIEAEERFEDPDLLSEHGVESGISTIIGDFEEPWGVLETHDTESRSYSDHDVQFVQSIANILAAAIDRHERERALEESERRYRTLVENFPNGAVALVDEDLHFQTFGGTPLVDSGAAEIEGQHVDDVVSDAIPPELSDAYRAAFRGERTRFEAQIGDSHHRISVTPVRDDDGEVFAALGMSQDVTEEKEYEQYLSDAKDQLEAATEAGAVGTWEWDVQEDRFVAGESLAETFGIDSEEAREGVPLERLVSSIHEDDRDRIVEAVNEAVETCGDYEAEYRVWNADDELRWVIARGTVECEDGEPVTFPGALTDITERKRAEQRLEQERERLDVLNHINDVVNEITHAVFGQSTREEIERIACEHLAATDSYEFAWIAEQDPRAGTVDWRVGANTGDYESRVDLSLDDPGPTAAAFRTGEMQTVRDVREDPEYERWRDLAGEYGFRSSAAIPVVHGDVVYGVLNVYADRPQAFEEREGRIVSQLGETLGHAIAAVERKHALMNDQLAQIEVGIDDVFGRVVDHDEAPRITIEEIVPRGDDEFLVFGEVDGDDIAPVEAMVEAIDHWTDVRVVAEGDPVRYQATVRDPPVLAPIATIGGSIEDAEIVDGDYFMRIRLPLGADSRLVIDTITEAYPTAEVLSHRQVTRENSSARELTSTWMETLTDRQRSALAAAYHAGYFSWPRDTDGEAVAESLGVSSPTFYQHLRAAEKKLFEALLERTDDLD